MNKSEPVGEEVEVVGVIRMDSDFVWEVDGPYALWRKLGEGVELMTVTQHQRLLEEAKQGQRVLAMECEQLKAQIPEYDELCHRHGVLQVTAREIQKERDQLKAELATAWGNAEKNARDCDDLRAQLARHDDATHNMAELLKRGAKAVGADPDNTSWFEVVGELEKLAAQKVVLPERRSLDTQRGDLLYRAALVWNACLDEVARLNKGVKP